MPALTATFIVVLYMTLTLVTGTHTVLRPTPQLLPCCHAPRFGSCEGMTSFSTLWVDMFMYSRGQLRLCVASIYAVDILDCSSSPTSRPVLSWMLRSYLKTYLQLHYPNMSPVRVQRAAVHK